MSTKLKCIIIFILLIVIFIPGCSVLSENKFQKGDILKSDNAEIKGNCAMYVVDYYPETDMYSIGIVVAKGNQWYRVGITGEQDVSKEKLEDPAMHVIAHEDGVLPIDNSLSFISSMEIVDSSTQSISENKNNPIDYKSFLFAIQKFIFDEPEFQEGDVILYSLEPYKVIDYDETNKIYSIKLIEEGWQRENWYVITKLDEQTITYSKRHLEDNSKLIDEVSYEPQIKN